MPTAKKTAAKKKAPANTKPVETPVVPESTLIEDHQSHLGPILGIFLIVLVLILGGLYLWGASLDKTTTTVPRNIENNEPETPRAQADTRILGTVSSSDSLEAIETDLVSTNLDTLDSELSEMEREVFNN